jgi:hypothetical protein
MKRRDLVNLLNRARAALETPKDLTPRQVADLIDDLYLAADDEKRALEEEDEV